MIRVKNEIEIEESSEGLSEAILNRRNEPLPKEKQLVEIVMTPSLVVV